MTQLDSQSAKRFLERLGYAEAIEKLDQNLSTSGNNTITLEELATILNTVPKKKVTNINLENASGNLERGRAYLGQYEKLKHWVEKSQPLNRKQYERLLFPIYCHCYLYLIKQGEVNTARKFILEFKGDHEMKHKREIEHLLKISTPEDIESDDYARNISNYKQNISMARVPKELFQQFLSDQNINCINSIQNEHLNIVVTQDNAHPVEGSEELNQDFNAYQRMEIQRYFEENQYLLRQDALFQKALKRPGSKRKRADMEDPASFAEKQYIDELYLESVNHIRLDSEFLPADLIEAATEMDVSLLRAPPTAPSCCFFTFFNSKNIINDIHIAPQQQKTYYHGPVMIAGCDDSIVRTWNWGIDHESITKIEENEKMSDIDGANLEITPIELVGHSGPVFSSSLSKDNKWLLTGSADKTIRLWHQRTVSPVVVYSSHEYAVWDVSFSPINYMFASASHDQTAQLWTTDRVSPVRILAGHHDDVECVRFHPNGNYVATASADSTCRLWDINSGEQVRLCLGHQQGVSCLAFSDNGKYLASGGVDGSIYIWSLESGRHIQKFEHGHTERITSISFSPDSKMVCTGAMDKTVRVFDLHHNEPMSTYYTKNTDVYFSEFIDNGVIVSSGCF
mmetsp:Transcript_8772/g.12995  ORF Transcript_8772/g.12995 Transcript_8772/m.12995 type:complete len:625 (+) Transcript_8772:32-1906(+)